MEPIVVFPEAVPPPVVDALDRSGVAWQRVDSAEGERQARGTSGWSAAVLLAGNSIGNVAAFARALHEELPDTPRLVVVSPSALADLAVHPDTFEDFWVLSGAVGELRLRVDRLVTPTGPAAESEDDLVSYGPLVINTVTYQAMLDGEPLDLTYMEYELLKYFAQHPGRVCTREVLLSQVWGYEYYGGARTVDVHVRRLRAKLGEPHAALIGTVRSVGYRFGKPQWA